MSDQPTTTVLRGATLIDGTGGAPLADSAIVIEGERIGWVGPAAALAVPAGAAVLDVAGMSVLPGLIDCHDHMIQTGFDLMRRAGGYGHGHNAVELQLLVEHGMTPMQAIVASTADAARLLEMDANIGTLRAGTYGDPLRDIAILDQPERIRLVMKGGHAYVNRLDAARVPVAS